MIDFEREAQALTDYLNFGDRSNDTTVFAAEFRRIYNAGMARAEAIARLQFEHWREEMRQHGDYSVRGAINETRRIVHAIAAERKEIDSRGAVKEAHS